MNSVKVALIGIGGHGSSHANMMVKLAEEGIVQLVAFAETNLAANRNQIEQLMSLGAKHYENYQIMLESHPCLDFVVISTPIPLHKDMSVYALEHGFHVLLEKPPAVTIQDMSAIVNASRQSGKLCGVLFQTISGNAIQLLIEKLREGAVGELQTVTGVGMWKRTEEYYARTPWAGKLIHNGKYVLDGTINNPFSHLLNNCLIAACYGNPTDAQPKRVQAELYKGHEIEGEDTSCVRIELTNNVQILFYATLCNDLNDTYYIAVKGTKGTMRWSAGGELIVADKHGNEESYSFQAENLIRKMYLNMIDALQGNASLYCSAEDCINFILASNGAFESSGGTYQIPSRFLTIREEQGTTATYINGVNDIFQRAAESGKLFSETSVEWAVRTKPFDLSHYTQLQLFK